LKAVGIDVTDCYVYGLTFVYPCLRLLFVFIWLPCLCVCVLLQTHLVFPLGHECYVSHVINHISDGMHDASSWYVDIWIQLML